MTEPLTHIDQYSSFYPDNKSQLYTTFSSPKITNNTIKTQQIMQTLSSKTLMNSGSTIAKLANVLKCYKKKYKIQGKISPFFSQDKNSTEDRFSPTKTQGTTHMTKPTTTRPTKSTTRQV